MKLVVNNQTEPERSKRQWKVLWLALGVMVAVFAIGMLVTNWPFNPSTKPNPNERIIRFETCEATPITCVVDGDTIWLEGAKIRIADIDTPEISDPKCNEEYALGMQAKHRLLNLLNSGPIAIENIGSEDEDKYGRKLRIISRDGSSIGNQLVKEGLARSWSGARKSWCNS